MNMGGLAAVQTVTISGTATSSRLLVPMYRYILPGRMTNDKKLETVS
jgi:hypothetical protein